MITIMITIMIMIMIIPMIMGTGITMGTGTIIPMIMGTGITMGMIIPMIMVTIITMLTTMGTGTGRRRVLSTPIPANPRIPPTHRSTRTIRLISLPVKGR